MIIGVTGYARHGKDSIATRLVDAWGFDRLGFADALKALLLEVNPYIWDGLRVSHLIAHGWEAGKEVPEIRRLLQTLGTGVRDIVSERAWIDALEREWLCRGRPHTVVPDVRFPNEAAFIKRHGGVLIRVIRPNFNNGVDPNHESERHVPNLPADFEIINDGDLTDLAMKVDAVMADIQEGFYAHRL